MINLMQPQTVEQLIHHLEAPEHHNGHGVLPSLRFPSITYEALARRHAVEHTDRTDLTHKHGIDL